MAKKNINNFSNHCVYITYSERIYVWYIRGFAKIGILFIMFCNSPSPFLTE